MRCECQTSSDVASLIPGFHYDVTKENVSTGSRDTSGNWGEDSWSNRQPSYEKNKRYHQIMSGVAERQRNSKKPES
jgi:hypothetical protein